MMLGSATMIMVEFSGASIVPSATAVRIAPSDREAAVRRRRQRSTAT
jgi:hypothetical protein